MPNAAPSSLRDKPCMNDPQSRLDSGLVPVALRLLGPTEDGCGLWPRPERKKDSCSLVALAEPQPRGPLTDRGASVFLKGL